MKKVISFVLFGLVAATSARAGSGNQIAVYDSLVSEQVRVEAVFRAGDIHENGERRGNPTDAWVEIRHSDANRSSDWGDSVAVTRVPVQVGGLEYVPGEAVVLDTGSETLECAQVVGARGRFAETWRRMMMKSASLRETGECRLVVERYRDQDGRAHATVLIRY